MDKASSQRLSVSRHYDATPEEVFDAWTDAEGLGEWMSPFPARGFRRSSVKLDPRVGGAFEIVMHGEDRDYPHRGVYKEIDRPRRLVFTWISKGTEQRESTVTIELKPERGGTLLTLTHEGLPSESLAKDHSKGWTEILEHLASVLD